MLDETDLAILNILRKNSRLQWKEIGSLVHLTGQAVAARVRRMEELDIIKGYSVLIDDYKLGKSVVALITVFMKDNHHLPFQEFLEQEKFIAEVYKISGEGCYWLKAILKDQSELNDLLNDILKFGNYRLNLAIDKVK